MKKIKDAEKLKQETALREKQREFKVLPQAVL